MAKLSWEAADTEGVWIGEARDNGPTVTILGSVHGDEPTGRWVIDALREIETIEKGTVILALGNLAASKLNKRFVDTNLNRSFRPLSQEEAEADPSELPYETRRAQALLPYLNKSRAALDIHDFTDPNGPIFEICERNALETARAIGAPVISFGWSKTEPGGSDGYMHEQGKEGICYEVGYKNRPEENLKRGIGAATRFLTAQGLSDVHQPPLFDNPLLIETSNAIIRTEEHYRLARPDFRTFAPLAPGELIVEHGQEKIYAEEGQVIIFPEANPPIGGEAFSLGRIVKS